MAVKSLVKASEKNQGNVRKLLRQTMELLMRLKGDVPKQFQQKPETQEHLSQKS